MNYMDRTSGEKADHGSAFPRSHNRSVSVTWKNISIVDLGCLLGFQRTTSSESSSQCLLMIENTGICFLVEAALGVETLCSYQRPGPLSRQFIQCVFM